MNYRHAAVANCDHARQQGAMGVAVYLLLRGSSAETQHQQGPSVRRVAATRHSRLDRVRNTATPAHVHTCPCHTYTDRVALSLEEALLIATFGSELLAAVTSRLADCSVLAAQWADLSTDIMSRVCAGGVCVCGTGAGVCVGGAGVCVGRGRVCVGRGVWGVCV